jgi:hypothetical protein
MKKSTFIILILIVFSSCKKPKIDKNFNIKKKPVLPIKIDKKYTLKIFDSIFIPIPKNINQSAFVQKLYKDSLLFFVYKSNKIALINIKNNKIQHINTPNSISGSIKAICIPNNDSIIIIQERPSQIHLINIHDTLKHTKIILKKINFNTKNKFFNDKSKTVGFNGINYNIDYNNAYYNNLTKLLYVGIEPYDSYLLKGFEGTNRIGVYDMMKEKWLKLYAKPRGAFSLRGDYSFGNNFLSFKNILFKGDTTFISYKINHTVSYYVKEKYQNEINFTSLESKNISTPLKPNEITDSEKNKQLCLSTPHYNGLYYHSKIKLYSRLYLDKQDAYTKDGTYTSYLDRNAIIVFFDKNLNYVGEYIFPKHKLGHLISTTNGFLMYTNKYTNFDKKRKYYNLKYVYKIKPIKQ